MTKQNKKLILLFDKINKSLEFVEDILSEADIQKINNILDSSNIKELKKYIKELKEDITKENCIKFSKILENLINDSKKSKSKINIVKAPLNLLVIDDQYVDSIDKVLNKLNKSEKYLYQNNTLSFFDNLLIPIKEIKTRLPEYINSKDDSIKNPEKKEIVNVVFLSAQYLDEEEQKNNLGLSELLEIIKTKKWDAITIDKQIGNDNEYGKKLCLELKGEYSDLEMVILSGTGDNENEINKRKWTNLDIEELLIKKISYKYQINGNDKEIICASNSNLIKKLKEATNYSKTNYTVLITGETGTGKEGIAEYIHSLSRPKKKFSPLNCGAIPENLIESELFGHENMQESEDRDGIFISANQGTVFLDEIGELPILQQPKLLRVLQEDKIKKIGQDQEIDINVRVITATNKNLKEEVKQKRFREDLYYRINTFTTELPSLRERRDDIPYLIEVFLERINKEQEKQVSFTRKALKVLKEYSWPGNIRQLQDIIINIVVLSEKNEINTDYLKENYSYLNQSDKEFPTFPTKDILITEASRIRRLGEFIIKYKKEIYKRSLPDIYILLNQSVIVSLDEIYEKSIPFKEKHPKKNANLAPVNDIKEIFDQNYKKYLENKNQLSENEKAIIYLLFHTTENIDFSKFKSIIDENSKEYLKESYIESARSSKILKANLFKLYPEEIKSIYPKL